VTDLVDLAEMLARADVANEEVARLARVKFEPVSPESRIVQIELNNT